MVRSSKTNPSSHDGLNQCNAVARQEDSKIKALEALPWDGKDKSVVGQKNVGHCYWGPSNSKVKKIRTSAFPTEAIVSRISSLERALLSDA
jgi:hypothetical protein